MIDAARGDFGEDPVHTTTSSSLDAVDGGSIPSASAPGVSAPETHPAHVARITENRFARAGWIGLGSVSLGLGLIGVVVPGWPTTIFVILAAACYARSSQRLYDRVIGSRLIGRHARAFRETGAMPRRAKALALGVMWPFVAVSVLFAIPDSLLAAKFATLALAAAGTAYILHLPSTQRASRSTGEGMNERAT